MYIVTEDEGATVGIREGGNVKKCRPVVKEPSGGTLLFRCALPARGTSRFGQVEHPDAVLCLGAACTRCITARTINSKGLRTLPRRCLHGVHHCPGPFYPGSRTLCLGAACTGCIRSRCGYRKGDASFASALPARGASYAVAVFQDRLPLCLGAACTGCISLITCSSSRQRALPRRCLHGVHHR